MKLKILLLIVALLLIPYISAVDSVVQEVGPYKQYECVRLPQICSNCSYINITSILYPDSSLASGEQVMIKDGTDYSYTFCNTSDSGVYIVNGKGDLDGEETIWNYKLLINPYGKEDKPVWNNPVLIILGILSLIFLFFAFYFKLPAFAFISGILFIIAGIYTMIYGLNELTSFYTRGISISLIGAGIIFMILSAWEWAMENYD